MLNDSAILKALDSDIDLDDVIEVEEPRNTRYNWSKAPAWAKFGATDEDGTTNWFAREPYIDTSFETCRIWMCNAKSLLMNLVWHERIPCADWRNSKEARPK